MAERRAAWPDVIAGIDPGRLVFLDEGGARTDMTRLVGWGPRGERVVDRVPAGHWRATTMIAAVRLAGPCAAVTIGGAVDAASFRTYLRDFLGPVLRPGDVVVMDNLSSHRAAGVAGIIRAVGATAPYLPPYSPDLNPIENLWAKVKAYLRRAAARTREGSGQAVGNAFGTVTLDDCRGFFRHCGYAAT